MINISVNKVPRSVRGKEDTSLLWVLRDKLKLSGTKFGCGAGLCGACWSAFALITRVAAGLAVSIANRCAVAWCMPPQSLAPAVG